MAEPEICAEKQSAPGGDIKRDVASNAGAAKKRLFQRRCQWPLRLARALEDAVVVGKGDGEEDGGGGELGAGPGAVKQRPADVGGEGQIRWAWEEHHGLGERSRKRF